MADRELTRSNQQAHQTETQCCAKPSPAKPTQDFPIQQLQRAIGNRAVGRRLQAKLEISQPHDVYEQEADRVADQVMRMPDLSTDTGKTYELMKSPESAAVRSESERQLQRKCTGCEEEEQLQAKEIPGERVSIDARVGELGYEGRPLDASVRSFFEPRFGYAFDQVQVHADARAATSARAVNAQAYTVGHDIVFGAGQYAPDTRAGKTLLAHELAHVVQQGGASSTDRGNSAGISNNVAARQVQRARLPCSSRKIIDVYSVDLPGATRTITDDLPTANSILCQCGIELNVVGGQSWATNLLDQDPPAGVLNAPASTVRPLTAEETTLLAHKPGGPDVIHVYYVPSFTGPKLAESFWPAQHGEHAVVVSNGAIPVVFPHELGHVLMNDRAIVEHLGLHVHLPQYFQQMQMNSKKQIVIVRQWQVRKIS